MIDMKMDDERIFRGQSSKGNQLKFEKNGIWYKADYTGYEGLAEYVVSALLRFSNLPAEDYILYETERIRYQQQEYLGCKSKNFLPDNWQIITLERIFQSYYGESLYRSIYLIQGVKERAEFLVSRVKEMTGLQEFGKYLCKVLTIDALFLNEDRHMHNIAVLLDPYGEYHYCPIFDNGAALLADTTVDYPMQSDIIALMRRIKAKTLCDDFAEQLDAVEELYGQPLKFSYDRRIIAKVLDEEKEYGQEEKERVREILLQQMRTYQYLFGVGSDPF